MNIFEQASRQQIRFASLKGLITTEDLWDLPLTSRNGFDLDAVAKQASRELKATDEESFVHATSAANAQLALKLDVVKHIIAVKLAENELARTRATRVAERQKLLGILADKQDAALKELTPEDIQKRLAELDA